MLCHGREHFGLEDTSNDNDNNNEEEEELDDLFLLGARWVLWWHGGALSHVLCILFTHLMMRPLVLLLLGGPAHHHFLFVCRERQGTWRCKPIMLNLKMMDHAIRLKCISIQHAMHGPVGARNSCRAMGYCMVLHIHGLKRTVHCHD